MKIVIALLREIKMKMKKQDAGALITYFASTLKQEMYWKVPHDGKWHQIGRRFYRERAAKCAEWSVMNYEGDLIEIGAHLGKTTAVLAKIAKEHNRKLIVIDPWNGGTEAFDGNIQYMHGDEYEIWCENTKEYSDVIELYRLPSQSPELPAILKEKQLCYAWVDGAHTTLALENDLELVRHCDGVIGVDDISYWLWCDICRQSYNLYATFKKFSRQEGFVNVKLDWLAEGYIFCGYKKDVTKEEFLGTNHKVLSKMFDRFSSVAPSSYLGAQERFTWLPMAITFNEEGAPMRTLYNRDGTPIPTEISADPLPAHIGPTKEECCE